jgi:hypothetical protein
MTNSLRSMFVPWLLVLLTVGCGGTANGGGTTSVGGSNDTSVGGASGVGGTTNNGGGAAATGGADCGECKRNFECVAYCGGPVLTASCCPCAEGTLDRVFNCRGTGGSSAVSGCAGALPLRCGDQRSQSTVGRADQASGYSCTQRALSGPEVLYAFQTETSGQVTVRITNLKVDLDLILLDACDSQVCAVASSLPLDLQTDMHNSSEWITLQAEAGQTYWLVVDGYAGASGDYTIIADCAR